MSYLKTLPTEFHKRWAVYLIVLEKPSCRLRSYIGSGTDAKSGTSSHLRHYDKGYLVARYVQQALKEGCTVQHKGFLCWTSIPSAAMVPTTRLIFVALEATFTYILCAMKGKTKHGYGMTDMCQWGRDKLEYDGCCGHNALSESPHGDIGLSAEELEAKALEWTR